MDSDLEPGGTRGRYRVVYHAGPSPIDTPYPFTHFGTEGAARRRAREAIGPSQTAILHRVRLWSQNPRRTYDPMEERDLGGLILDTLPRYEEARRLLEHQAPTPAFQWWLLSRGYDGLYYRNRVEDPGTISWINVWSWQAVVTERTVL
jgi:hypothetical protein